MSEQRQPVFTPEQVEALNAQQQRHDLHPYTCGGNRCDEAHKAYQAEHGGDYGQLVATTEGWICPVPGCGYRQSWAREIAPPPLFTTF